MNEYQPSGGEAMNFELMAFFQAALFLFAIVDPVGGVPIFISLTEGADDNERRRLLRFAVFTAFLLVLAFALLGSVIMTYVFHISMGEFTFAGGLLLAVVGIRDMVRGGRVCLDSFSQFISGKLPVFMPLPVSFAG